MESDTVGRTASSAQPPRVAAFRFAAFRFAPSRMSALALAFVLTFALGACTEGPPPRTTTRVSGVGGTILALTQSGGAPVQGLRLPSEVVAPVESLGAIPTSTDTVTHASAPDPEGGTDLLSTDRRGVASVSRVASTNAASRVGPTLDVVTPKPFTSLDVANGVALVGACSKVWTMSLAHATRWTPVATGCWAGLSPDARSLIFSPDGSTAEEMRLPGGHPHLLLSAGDVAGLFPQGSPPPRLLGPPSWGAGGIAFAARSGGNVAIALRAPDGTIESIVHEAFQTSSQLPRFAWQPGGDLLAIADNLGPSGGVLRIYDARTHEVRAVGLDLLGFAQPVWSPDGRSVATLTSAKALVVVEPSGDWRLRVQTTWSDLLGWAS